MRRTISNWSAGLLRNHQRPVGGQHGQQFAPPGFPLRPDFVRLSQAHQVADGPGDDVAAAVQVALATLGGPHHASEVACHGGFLGDNRNRLTVLGRHRRSRPHPQM